MSTSSPETHTGNPAPSSEIIAGYTIDALDAWRASEDAVLTNLRGQSVGLDTSYIDAFRSGVAQRLEAYLQAQGITQSDPYYNDIRDLYAGVGIDQVDSDRWGNSPASRGTDPNDHLSERDKFADALRQWQENHTTTTPDDPDKLRPMTPEEWAAEKGERNSEYEAIMTKYAELVAKRSGKLFERKRTRAEIDAAKEDVTDLLSGLATQMMDELLAAGKSEAEMAKLVGDFVDAESDKLLGAMENYRYEQYDKEGHFWKRLWRKGIDKWAQWTEESTDKETGRKRFFSKGNFKKIGALALPAAVVGAGAVPLIGLFAPVAAIGAVIGGTGVAIGAGAGIVGRSVGRSIAGGYLDRKANEKRLAGEQSSEMKAQYEQSMAIANEKQRKTIFEIVDERSETYRKRNRNRAIGGAATAAVFSLLGSTVAAEIANKVDVVDWAANRVQDVRNFFGGNQGSGTNAVVDAKVPTTWKDAPIPKTDYTPSATSGEVWSVDAAVEHISHDAATIDKGEGLFQTFKDSGVAKDHWGELMDKVGPKLDEKYPNLVYKHNDEWRLFLNDGKMPEGASKIILQEAHDNGWLTDAAEATGDVTIDATTSVADVPESVIIDQSGLAGLESASENGASWIQLKGQLDTIITSLQAGDMSTVNSGTTGAAVQEMLGYVHEDLNTMTYPNSQVPIVVFDDHTKHWMISPVPSGSYVPQAAIDILGKYNTYTYALAA